MKLNTIEQHMLILVLMLTLFGTFLTNQIIEQNKDNMEVLAQALLASSLDAGGTDNTSIITIKVSNKQENVWSLQITD